MIWIQEIKAENAGKTQCQAAHGEREIKLMRQIKDPLSESGKVRS